ncbi:GH92 family glycosyl hydrolase [Microbulbifer sp.]|uniref:GH92 family glycosyl hydrolase n=1 Tax=Microbulbifer sp. TaxID=1908541 RepID=UPI003F30B46E
MKQLLSAALLLGTSLIASCTHAEKNNYQYIDPFIGSEGEGNVFVGPSAPFGMVKPGPDIDIGSNSGYSPNLNKPLHGFSQVHVSGTGGGPKYGNISVMPYSGEFEKIEQTSLRQNEVAKAGYYSADLTKWKIKAELTASDRVAFHQYTFKDAVSNAIKIDGGFFLGETPVPDAREAQQFVGSEVHVLSSTQVEGYSRIRGGWNNGAAYTVYYYAEFDQPFTDYSTFKGKNISPKSDQQYDSAEKTGALLFFNQHDNKKIKVKIGISFVSSAKAKHNVENEVPHWNFNQVLAQTQQKWEKLISRIEIDSSATQSQKTMFYTALYHTMLMPVNRTGENPLWTAAPYYDDFYAIWDTFRTSSPLITLISPSRQAEIINAMINIYKYDGYLPDARSGNSNGRTQGGSNAAIVITDAYVKDVPGVNYHAALKGMIKDATVPPGDNEEKHGRGGLVDYNNLGYVSTDYVRSGNRTLEYAYNDYAIAVLAKGLGRMGEYYRYLAQSDNWKNLWRDISDNGSQGFIMPRDSSGQWVDKIQCDVSDGRFASIDYHPLAQDWPNCVCWWCGFFYEASSWEYSLYVPHDIAAVIEKSGGDKAFEKRLNTLFDKSLYNVGNEPSFLSPTLYHWIARPDLSSKRIHKIIDKNYNSTRAGIPGNDDSGAMSSWLAFHMMGIFPNAGQAYYLLNTPYFKRVTLHQENGKSFTIEAKNLSDKNNFIVSAELNGKPYNLSWIEHKEIIKGGKLTLTMGSQATDWGSKIRPPSKSTSTLP